MATTRHHFETLLNSLIQNVSAITQAATAPMTRLIAAGRPLPVVRAANDTLTRLTTFASGAYVANEDGTTRNKSIRPVTVKQDSTGEGRVRQSSERPLHKLAQILNRVAELAPQRARQALGPSRADSRARSLGTSMRRFVDIGTAPVQRFTRGNFPASNLRRQAALAKIAIGGFGVGFIQSRHARPASASRWSVAADMLGGLRTTIAGLYRLLALAPARARSAAARELLSRATVTSMLTGLWAQPHFTFTNHSSATQLHALAGTERAVSKQPLTAYPRNLDIFARKVTSLAMRSGGIASPNVAALPDDDTHLQPAWLRRLQQPELPKRGVASRRGPLSERLDRSASASAAPTPTLAPPSTINVAINVHGVTNGDDFVRRHGYAIAQVLDQVMERRTRRAF
jgi:hypothetical protein